MATNVLKGIEELGLRLNPSSRLARQANVYLDPTDTLPQMIPPDHALFQAALEAKRDLGQVGFILKQLAPVVPREALRSRLQRLIKDSMLPQDDPGQSAGRDVQCELFVAALCQRAGLCPILDEPDVRCTLGQQVYGIAVKRTKNEQRFENRFREAVEQITVSKLPGIIVIDISRSLNQTNLRVSRDISDAQFFTLSTQVMVRFEGRFHARMLEWTRGTGVRGWILLDHHVREHAVHGWGFELTSFGRDACPYHQGRRREFKAFSDRFGRAVCNPGGPRPDT